MKFCFMRNDPAEGVFYSFVLLISFTQGTMYSVLLLLKVVKTENNLNYRLTLFIFLCSLYIAPWMLGFDGWYGNQPYGELLFYTPFQQLFFVGLIVFFHTQRLLNSSFKFLKKKRLVYFPVFSTSYTSKRSGYLTSVFLILIFL
jgi:hypothetical protein